MQEKHMIAHMAREAFDDYVKRKGRKPDTLRIGRDMYRRFELERVDMWTPQGLRYMGCKVVLTEHQNQLQFVGEL